MQRHLFGAEVRRGARHSLLDGATIDERADVEPDYRRRATQQSKPNWQQANVKIDDKVPL